MIPQRAEENETVGGTTYATRPDAERKAIAHADLYTTGGLLRALQNAIEEANAFESTPHNLRVLAARAMVVARRREIRNQDPNHLDCSPSMAHKDL